MGKRNAERAGRAFEKRLPDDLVVDFTVNVGQPEVATAVAVGQLRMVHAEQMQDRRVQVVDVHPFVDGVYAKLIRRTVDITPFGASTGQPGGEAGVMMVPAFRALGRRGSPELAAPDDERVFQQTSRFEIRDERCDWLIAFAGIPFVVHDVAVSVPGLAAAVVELNHPHASLDQSPRDEAAVGELTAAVRSLSFFRLSGDVECLGRSRLHPVSDFERLNSRLQILVLLAFLKMLLVHRLQQIEKLSLRAR